MIDIVGDKCIGCGACASICGKSCIVLRPNHEGFLYPAVDNEKCVHCNRCDSVCPVLYNGNVCDINDAKIYGIKAKGEFEKEILKSASAGVFYFIANHFTEMNGYVYGAAFDSEFNVKHICGKTYSDIIRMQNSKYVQSDTSGVYKEIADIFKREPDACILFCGTPCQCLGLKAYLGKEYDHLYLLDLVCHGVPSPLAYRKYLNYLKTIKKEDVHDFQFRYKHKGWNYHGYMSSFVKFNNHFWPTVRDPYMSSFLKQNDYRECCYTCQYNTSIKVSDLSLADFSGVRDIAPEFFTEAGCSTVYVNSPKGLELLAAIKDYIGCMEIKPEWLKGYGTILKKKRIRPKTRDIIYKNINEFDDKTYVEKRLKSSVSFKSVLRFYIPYSVRRALKQMRRK